VDDTEDNGDGNDGAQGCEWEELRPTVADSEESGVYDDTEDNGDGNDGAQGCEWEELRPTVADSEESGVYDLHIHTDAAYAPRPAKIYTAQGCTWDDPRLTAANSRGVLGNPISPVLHARGKAWMHCTCGQGCSPDRQSGTWETGAWGT
jgi:hypothetical protein